MIGVENYVDGDTFESIADFGFGDQYTTKHPLDINKLITFINNFKKDRLPIIYVDSSRTREFFSLVGDVNEKFILISHNEDTIFNESDVKNKPKCIVKWYGLNINAENTEDVITIPVGLERKFWSKTSHGTHANKHNKIEEYSKKEHVKNTLCYINFNVNTNRTKREWIIPHFCRNTQWSYCRMGGWRGNIDTYFRDCISSHYVMCPGGNGIDTHRTWEMLYLGVVPIVERTHYHQQVYGDMNVLIVDSFKEINEDFLKEQIEKLKSRNNNEEKLYSSYWKKFIIDGAS